MMLTSADRDVTAVQERRTSEPLRTLLAMKGTPAWHDWLKDCARSLGVPTTILIDLALREYATKNGFTKPMPGRYLR
jgi:hypothetical protein